MSLDRSLKSGALLARHRNVLTRAERIVRLREADKWPEGRSVLNLPKVANRKISVGKKATKTADAAATPAAPAAGAKGGKAAAAAPAAVAGKAAAPAAKAPAGKK